MEQTLNAQQWQALVQETRQRIMKQRKRVWPEGETRTCPHCQEEALVGRSDLTHEVDANGAVLVFANLHGAVCETCGTQFLEGYEQLALEERAGTAFRSPVSGSVTALGGGKLGTYWPKDVAAALGLHPRDALQITPLSQNTVVVRVIHAHA